VGERDVIQFSTDYGRKCLNWLRSCVVSITTVATRDTSELRISGLTSNNREVNV